MSSLALPEPKRAGSFRGAVALADRFFTPTNVLAVTLLFVNDHVLKHAWPGFVTGKLSDVAGMVFFPALLHLALWPLAARYVSPTKAAHDRLLLVVCLATAIVFTLTKTSVLANEAYRFTWGALQWPLHALRATMQGHALPKIARVVLVRDPSDVLAVPFVVVAYRSLRSRA